MNAYSILVVDDEPDIRQVVSDILQDEGYHVSVAADAAEARTRYVEDAPDLVLLDIWIGGLGKAILLMRRARYICEIN